LTYPHDFVLSRTVVDLLRRIIGKTPTAAKSLILLTAFACRERGQGGAKRDGMSLAGQWMRLTHKVFHSRGGELQNAREIIDLRDVCERLVKISPNAPLATHGRR
jgi:hypothetical protein